MNRKQIKEHSQDALLDVDLLLDGLIKKGYTPYVNSIIVAGGLRDTINQIREGFDEGYHTEKLTPSQRAVFVWCYIEVLTGFIEYCLQANDLPEIIVVKE